MGHAQRSEASTSRGAAARHAGFLGVTCDPQEYCNSASRGYGGHRPGASTSRTCIALSACAASRAPSGTRPPVLAGDRRRQHRPPRALFHEADVPTSGLLLFKKGKKCVSTDENTPRHRSGSVELFFPISISTSPLESHHLQAKHREARGSEKEQSQTTDYTLPMTCGSFNPSPAPHHSALSEVPPSAASLCALRV